MPRPQNILRPIRLHTAFPEDIRAKMDLHLFSQVEGRVPHGAYQQFLIRLVREFFEPNKPQPQSSCPHGLCKICEAETKSISIPLEPSK